MGVSRASKGVGSSGSHHAPVRFGRRVVCRLARRLVGSTALADDLARTGPVPTVRASPEGLDWTGRKGLDWTGHIGGYRSSNGRTVSIRPCGPVAVRRLRS